ncbi:MAG: hypothetical protein PHF14_00820 [Verrucomicrobiota bacterium]|nr:hypothetical protein [Verrucomicrobiota bacterium]MDD8044984.1 hypothetical protein [Verrucomicrobiota bacterium]MDD8050390.1 hypothetical protein [Verrucomicrobiota bacterium]MDI9384009.1 hypothetical protein [Verrucomicrobiota bacterium]
MRVPFGGERYYDRVCEGRGEGLFGQFGGSLMERPIASALLSP